MPGCSKQIRVPARPWLAALLLCAGLAACAQGPRAARLSIFVSGNTAGYLENCGCSGGQYGGLARRAAQLRIERTAAARPLESDAGRPAESLLIDCGNFSDFTEPMRAIESAGIVQAMGLLEYDAVGLGLNEAESKQEKLLALLQNAELPYVASNLEIIPPKAGKDCSVELRQLLRPYRVVRKTSGLRVGILHLLDNQRIDLRSREGLGYRISDPFEAAKSLLAAHRAEADLWVLSVSALRQSAMQPQDFSVLPGVSAVAGLAVRPGSGKRNNTAPAPRSAGQQTAEASPPPLQIGRPLDKGKDLLALSLQLSGTAEAQSQPRAILLADTIQPDPQVQAISDALKPQREELELVHAREAIALQERGLEHPYYQGWQACAACHPTEVARLADSKHMHAYATLVEKGTQHTSCAKCHTLGYNRPSGYNAVQDREHDDDWMMRNVQCENCHGPGEYHIMLQKGEPPPADLRRRGRNEHGLMPAGPGSCRGCHDHENSPQFEFTTYWPKIVHGNAH